ncbi:hypothetical protein HCN44_005911 [Aphidius gifuensis]|uniref:SAM domain-containing protein n=1 Tax=Aphidius gifuensis TaxID=684658 RepID=A0A834XVX4_APHGI|nr:uncharacterized protein C19orf47 homolog [Aphidius gifuensis]KAF7993130.1 hypothetical protein HCN44_005911 [Aphidius gifuensis]
MAMSLSTYWVKFFTNAGFPHDVATKHAVVFSNNRIKPDMLPDLDKPSLKEMGITLMGDMIAILRYAKKVSEEMTCERFLVDTIDDTPMPKIQKIIKAPIKKSVASKVSNVTPIPPSQPLSSSSSSSSSSLSSKFINASSIINNVAPSKGKEAMRILANEDLSLAQKKKTNVLLQPKRVVSQVVAQSVKRKIVDKVQEISSDSDDEEWSNNNIQKKRIKLTSDDDDIIVLKNREQLSRFTIKNNHDTNNDIKKKSYDQKKTVFERLGDSSVTSTTNINDSNTTFNITGLGDVFKRNNSSVFNRLGDKDAKNESSSNTSVLKNGTTTSNGQPQGILKAKISNLGTTTVKITSPINLNKIKTGTMHADYEKNKKTISSSVKQLVKTTKAIRITTSRPPITVHENTQIHSKLASERTRGPSVTAKSRLGLTGSQKQVTFNRVATVAHIKKPGVFSRLGV